MSKKKQMIFVLMIITALAITVSSTLAFFSTYTRVKGTAPIGLSESSKFKETEIEGGKHVVITCLDGSDPIYVRVKAFAFEEILEQLEYKGDNWTKDGDWYYYDLPLRTDKTEAEKQAVIDIVLKEDAQIDLETFNIIVVYEFIPASVDTNGNLYPDWTAVWTIEEGGNG
ncbi:MAG: hypothetical protein IKE38_03640, partial [Erysipelotrichaceae bacterium]|nr:hypothetical protein [Erysipelotrichaceae bacterium]